MTDRKEFRELVDPETAEAAVAALPINPGTEERPLKTARGATLAERIDATIDVPGFDRATLDGYAVNARDTFGADEAEPVTLSVVGVVEAGEQPPETLSAGEAVEIATGAVLPPGADAMVPIERIREGETTIDVETSNFVAPSPYPAFLRSSGTALIASSLIEETIGIVIIPIIIEAESALNAPRSGKSVACSAGVT